MGGLIGLAAITLCLQSLIFAPHAAWPLAYVCLVPWVVSVCAGSRARTVYLLSYLLGAAFFLVNMRWLRFSTFPGYVALSLWSGVYYLVASWAVRHAWKHRGIPLTLVLPVIWVMTELARSRTALSFPWFLLGHSQYARITLIQISDLAGVYAVSFVVAAINGWFCDWVLGRVLAGRVEGLTAVPLRRLLASAAFAGGLLVAAIGYGRYRLAQPSLEPGPRIAVLQGDHLLSPDRPEEEPWIKSDVYMRLLMSAREHDPDLFLFPETPWTMYLNAEGRDRGERLFQLVRLKSDGRYRVLVMNSREPPADSFETILRNVSFSRACHEMFCRTAAEENAYVVVGSVSFEPYPTRVYPRYERFNSAFVYNPGRPLAPSSSPEACAEPGRYDKIHLVLFGEYVPFRYGRLHSVYRWLNSLTPWGANGEEYSLSFGQEHKIFEMQTPSRNGQPYRFAVPICYEDVIPPLIRNFVIGQDGRKRVDFLLNISNDGWFHHSTELPQHLVCCAFRAVENRVSVARAVNTGISGFIDPDGTIHTIVEAEGRQPWEGVTGYRVSELKIDRRRTVYSRWGDWFAYGCAAAGLLCLLDAFVLRVRVNRSAARAGRHALARGETAARRTDSA